MDDSSGFLAFSEAAQRNSEAILTQLRSILRHDDRVLEVGSGSGQHAVRFSAELDGICWQPTETEAMLPLLSENLNGRCSDCLLSPVLLDLALPISFKACSYNAVYTANTLHIVNTRMVTELFSKAAYLLRPGAVLIIYGPFCYQGAYTSASNRAFDRWLKQRDPESGIRDIEFLTEIAAANALELQRDISMPANNQLLVWKKL